VIQSTNIEISESSAIIINAHEKGAIVLEIGVEGFRGFRRPLGGPIRPMALPLPTTPGVSQTNQLDGLSSFVLHLVTPDQGVTVGGSKPELFNFL
jgi:hypothetical protein